MKINDALQIVLPVRTDNKDKATIHAYHTPISRDVFEANYKIIAATKAELASKGAFYQMDAGPRIAALTLKEEGRKNALAQGDVDADGNPHDGGSVAFFAEMKRLTTILAPSASGWDMIPVDAAIAQGILDADDWRECESALVFFTCHFAMVKKSQRKMAVDAIAQILNGSSTSLSLTDFAASCPTLIAKEVIVAVAGSSVPS